MEGPTLSDVQVLHKLNARVAAVMTPDRTRTYLLAVAGALVAAFLILLATADGVSTPGGGRIGGDWASFYIAGSLAAQDRLPELYDWQLQQTLQAPYLPGTGGVVPFAYPPFVAAAYAPFVPAGFVASYVLHTALMVGLLGLAVRLARPLWPRLTPHVLFAGALAYPPLYRASFGGQGTALTLLLLVLIARGVSGHRPAWSGLALGLLCFKPTYALVVGLTLLAHGERRALAIAAGVAGALWALTAAVLGVGWAVDYLHALQGFAEMDWQVDLSRSVALASLPRWAGMSAAVGRPVGVILGLTALAVAMPALRRARTDPGRWLGLLGATVLIASPHVGFYDAGLGFLALAAWANAAGSLAAGPVLALTGAAMFASWQEPPWTGLILTVSLLMFAGLARRAPPPES